ncbi:MAG: hypothetical protein JWM20_769 [Patescibacteria group bacterium]|nr:hypothetical protein [Patescibacteria group bacterium]
MKPKDIPLKAIRAAGIHVTSKYLFTADHYPALVKLSGNDAKAFAIKHCLLHILKSMETIIEFSQNPGSLRFDEKVYPLKLKTALAKVMVNTLAISNQLGVNWKTLKSEYDFRAKMFDPLASGKPFEFTFCKALVSDVAMIAESFEKYDHGTLYEEVLGDAKAGCRYLFCSILMLVEWLLKGDKKEFLIFLPSVMKSK